MGYKAQKAPKSVKYIVGVLNVWGLALLLVGKFIIIFILESVWDVGYAGYNSNTQVYI